MKKVLITNDFITSSKTIFVHRVLAFLKEILEKLKVEVHFDYEVFDESFIKEFCSLNNSEYNSNTKFYLPTFNPNEKSYDFLSNYISKFDLIIGYELSELTKKSIDFLGIKYLDVWLSPIRFLNDLRFCFYSNDENIHHIFCEYKFDIKKIFNKAKIITNNIRLGATEVNELPENSNLIVTQSMEDKSIVKNNKFLKLSDYREQLESICKKYTNNFILKHPNLNEKEFRKICEELSNEDIKPINFSGYKLLSSKNIIHLTGLSSSLLEEAKFFGKKITYLYKPVIDTNYIQPNDEIFNSGFWSKVLNLNSKINYKFIHHDNYFRDIFGKSWAYEGYLKNESSIYEYKVIIKFLTKLKELDNNTQYTLLGLGTISKFIIDYNLLKVKRVLEANAVCKKYKGIDVVSVNNIQRGENIIITPFYDASKVSQGIKSFRPMIHQINF